MRGSCCIGQSQSGQRREVFFCICSSLSAHNIHIVDCSCVYLYYPVLCFVLCVGYSFSIYNHENTYILGNIKQCFNPRSRQYYIQRLLRKSYNFRRN